MRMGKEPAEPEPGDRAQHQQRGYSLGESARQREQAEQQRACDDHAFAAELVAEIAQNRGAEHEAAEPRSEHGAESCLVGMPCLDDGRSGIADDLHIIAFDKHEGADPEHQAGLKPAEFLPLDQRSDINGSRMRHGSFPPEMRLLLRARLACSAAHLEPITTGRLARARHRAAAAARASSGPSATDAPRSAGYPTVASCISSGSDWCRRTPPD